MIVEFFPAKNGGVMARLGGVIAFPGKRDWQERQPQPGEKWEVELAGKNPAGTVYFLRPLASPEQLAERQTAKEAARETEWREAQTARKRERLAIEEQLDKTAVLAALRRGEMATIAVEKHFDGEDGYYCNPLTVEIGGQHANFESASQMGRWEALCHCPGEAAADFWRFIGWDDLADDIVAFSPPLVEGYEPETWEWQGLALVARGWAALGQFVVEDAHAEGILDIRLHGAVAAEYLRVKCEKALSDAQAALLREGIITRIREIERKLGGYPTPRILNEDVANEIRVGGHVFVISALMYFDSGSKYAEESDDGYRRGGWYQSRRPGNRTIRGLTFDGRDVRPSSSQKWQEEDVTAEDVALVEAMEAAFVADSPEGALIPGETRSEATGRLGYDLQNLDLLPSIGAPWSPAGVFIGEIGPLENAGEIAYRQVITKAGMVVYETGGTIDNRFSQSGKYVQANHGQSYSLRMWLEESGEDPRLLKVEWVQEA